MIRGELVDLSERYADARRTEIVRDHVGPGKYRPEAEVAAWVADLESPVPATRTLLDRLGLDLADMAAIELNEAFAAQSLACLRELGLPDDADHVNPNGGAISLGHPLGMSGARLVGTLSRELERRDGRYGLATMCIGVGQGIAMVLERP